MGRCSLFRDRRRFCALVALLLGLPAALRAQERPLPEGLSLAEAVRLTLESDPNLRLEEARLRSAHGSLLSSRGTFDSIFSSSLSETETDLPVSATESSSQAVVGNTLGITKRFRTGLSIEPELELLRTDPGGAGAVNVGTFSFTVRQPLLEKGLTAGRLLVDSPEDPTPQEILLDVELVPRGSARPAA